MGLVIKKSERGDLRAILIVPTMFFLGGIFIGFDSLYSYTGWTIFKYLAKFFDLLMMLSGPLLLFVPFFGNKIIDFLILIKLVKEEEITFYDGPN